jgi:RNA polymerase sigma factor, sigma-70 family
MTHAQKEFLKIVADYQKIIHKVNLIYFKSEMDRKDNFQEVIYQLWKSFPALKKRDKPASWIYSVAINTSISKIRKDCKLKFYDNIPDNTPIEQNESYEYDNNYRQLLNALYGLNEIDRSLMLLYLEDLNYDEIAEIIGISVSNVGVKIHRLKNQLQKQLNG